MNDLIILYSGGADSRLMLELALRMDKNPLCLLIDYEQLHIDELEFARRQLAAISGVTHQTVSIKNLLVNSGLTGHGDKDETGEVNEMYVSGRNTMFLSIAFSIAESRDINTIWLGADWSDRENKFPDCKHEYIEKINELFDGVAGPKTIKVEAPISGFSKEMVINILKSYGITESSLFSGYGEL